VLLMACATSEFGCWKRILSQHALHHGLLECIARKRPFGWRIHSDVVRSPLDGFVRHSENGAACTAPESGFGKFEPEHGPGLGRQRGRCRLGQRALF
jgi:hypothetical protein